MTRKKAIVLAGFFCFAIVAGARAGAVTLQSGARPEPELPIAKVDITIQDGQREAFFEKINQFSKKNAFAVRVAPTYPGSDKFLIQLWREDVKIIGTNSFEQDVYGFGFYNNDAYDPPEESLDHLLSDLKKAVCELPDVKFYVVEDD